MSRVDQARRRRLASLPTLGVQVDAKSTVLDAGIWEAERATSGETREPAPPPIDGLVEYCRVLWRFRRTVAFVAVGTTLAAITVTMLQTPVYQARAVLEFQDLNRDFLNTRNVTPVGEGANYAVITDMQTQIGILQSETLLRAALETTAQRDSAPPAVRKTPIDRLLAQARPNLDIQTAGQTRLIEVLYSSHDPVHAAELVNTLVRHFIDQSVQARTDMTRQTGVALQQQLDGLRTRLEQSESQLQQYAQRAGLLFTNERNNMAEDKLRQLQEELSRATADRVQKQSRLDTLRGSPPEAVPDILNDPTLRENHRTLIDLRRTLAELTTTFTAEHSAVRKVQAQIATLEVATVANRAAIVGRIENEFAEATRRERLLAAAYAAHTRTLGTQAQQLIQYYILKREVDTNRHFYDAMLQRVKETTLASAIQAPNVRIVDPAAPPSRPYKPQLPLRAVLGLMAGSLLGVGFVLARHALRRTVEEPGDATYYLHVRELGVIPAFTPSGVLRRRGKLSDPVGLMVLKNAPVIVESFRSMLMSILSSAPSGHGGGVILFTSARSSEGKTTVVSNVGVTMAAMGYRVLLIDADVRRPSLHALFDVPGEHGLLQLLEEPASFDATECSPPETAIPNLHVLPVGVGDPATASNLLLSSRLPELLASFRRRFDVVLLDTAPVLPFADARIVSRSADGVVLVLRAGSTVYDDAIAAIRQLADDKARILGTVLNGWDASTSGMPYAVEYERKDAVRHPHLTERGAS